MRRNQWIVLIGLAFLVLSCKSKKTVTETKIEPVAESSAEALRSMMIRNQVSADWFSAKLKLNLKSEKLTIGLSGNIRLEKDKAIWINVKKFGLEAARVLIQPDSIFVKDRFGGNDIAEDLSYVQRSMNFPANFQMLQALVLGNPVFFTNDLEMKKDSAGLALFSESSKPKSHYLLNESDYSIQSMTFKEDNPMRYMEIQQSDYQEIVNRVFSHLRVIDADSQESGKTNLKIQMSAIEFDVPKNMPFKK